MALTPIEELQRKSSVSVLQTRIRFLNRELRAGRIDRDTHKRRTTTAQKAIDKATK